MLSILLFAVENKGKMSGLVTKVRSVLFVFYFLLSTLGVLNTQELANSGNITSEEGPLETLMNDAAQNHPSLKAAYLNWQASLEKIPQSAALPDPIFSTGYFILPVETRLGPQRMRLSLNQQFPWFGTLKAKKDKASQEAAVAYAAFEVIKSELLFDVKQQYFTLFGTKKQIELTEEQLALFKSMESLMLENYQNDLVELSELLRLQMQIAEKETNLTNLKQSFKAQQISLAEKTGVILSENPNWQVSLPDTLTNLSVKYTLDALIDSAKSVNPTAYLFKQQIKVANKEIDLSQYASKPKINAGLDYGLLGQRTDANPENNGRDILMPMVGISLPIFNKKSYRSVENEARLNLERNSEKHQAYLNQLESQLNTTYTNFKNKQNTWALLTEQQNTLQQIETLTQEKYSNATAKFTDLLKVKIAQIDLEIGKQKAMVEMAIDKAKLQQLSGLEKI